MNKLDVLRSFAWHRCSQFSIPGWTVYACDDISLYALLPAEGYDWTKAVIFTNWRRTAAEFAKKANRYLAKIAENGKVAWVESGRDCDCVEYSGRVHIVNATWEAFEKLSDGISEWADGPFHLSLARVSETRQVKYESRDLALEAFEDGHPHHIVSQFP